MLARHDSMLTATLIKVIILVSDFKSKVYTIFRPGLVKLLKT